jgi:hypothetical protein
MSIREDLLLWAGQFENDHYVFEAYGDEYTVDLPRETVEAAIDIAITLVDRVVAAKGDLHTAEYEALEARVRQEHPGDSAWLFHIVLEALRDDHLFGRYRDIEPMIGRLSPRGYPAGSAAYLLTVRPELHKLIYAVIRHVDDVEENYVSLVYTFFIGILAKGWGEGTGWRKTPTGWQWSSEQDSCQSIR